MRRPGKASAKKATAAGVAEPGAVLAALADPTRRMLLDVLASLGEATATTAAGKLPVTRQAVVKHLGVLDRAGLVDSRRSGRDVRYSVRAAPLQSTAAWLTSLADEWDARLAVIKRIAESDATGSRGRGG